MPGNILPRDENVWLLVADSVYVEPDGKVSLLGFYGTEHIQLGGATVLPAQLPLSFVFLLRDGG